MNEDKFFKQLKETGHKLTLDPHAKRDVRARLVHMMQTHDLVTAPRRSHALSGMFLKFGSIAALIMLASAGTALGAQNALPGDVLYPVKLHVNEKLETALASSPEAKALVSADLAERRLSEADQ